MKTKLKMKLLSYAFFSAISLNEAHATGIPVFDAAAAANAIQEFMQMLKEYEQQLNDYAKQISMYEQQLKDGAQSQTFGWGDFADLYNDLNRTVQGIESLRSRWTTTKDYIANNYGDPDYWENCFKTKCSFFSTAQNSYRATVNQLTMANAVANDLNEFVAQNNEEVDSLMRQIEMGDEGINANVQYLNKMQALNAKTQAAVAQMMSHQIQAETAARIAEEQYKMYERQVVEDYFKNVEVKKVSNPIRVEDF